MRRQLQWRGARTIACTRQGATRDARCPLPSLQPRLLNPPTLCCHASALNVGDAAASYEEGGNAAMARWANQTRPDQ